MLHYTVHINDSRGHYFDVSLSTTLPVTALNSDENRHWVDLKLPAWIPGSYLIREFARHILYVNSKVDQQKVPCTKINKDTWRVHVPIEADCESVLLNCEWRVYAWDLSVRGAHLDETHGFFNGTSLFLCPEGLTHQPIELRITRGHENQTPWRVACGLTARKRDNEPVLEAHGCPALLPGGDVVFDAQDYDALIDHPVEMGALQIEHFDVLGVPHVFAVYGADKDLDLRRICEDLKPVCEAQICLFEPESKRAPFERYVFMLHATDNGYGGLEHRNSTALLCNAADLPQRSVPKAPKGYEGFLGLCSHEYFHSWNVKRMKPAAFVPYDLTLENYTRLLWIFEGFTSYYDDIMLARTGKLDEQAYLKAVGRNVAQVMKGPGRLNQSVADSSMDAWTKYYRQDENALNSIVSYYTKGSLVALCLDSTIRKLTDSEKSLDDVMRLMWQRHGLSGIGVNEGALPQLVQDATGLNLAKEIESWTEQATDLPLDEALKNYGFSIRENRNDESIHLGLFGQFKAEGMLVKQVKNGSPAHLAGISAGDLLVAVGDKRVTETQYKRTLTGSQAGEVLNWIGFRADRLMQFSTIAEPASSNEWLIEKENAPNNQAAKLPWLPQ